MLDYEQGIFPQMSAARPGRRLLKKLPENPALKGFLRHRLLFLLAYR
jgi:hypothetical protein